MIVLSIWNVHVSVPPYSYQLSIDGIICWVVMESRCRGNCFRARSSITPFINRVCNSELLSISFIFSPILQAELTAWPTGTHLYSLCSCSVTNDTIALKLREGCELLSYASRAGTLSGSKCRFPEHHHRAYSLLWCALNRRWLGPSSVADN